MQSSAFWCISYLVPVQQDTRTRTSLPRLDLNVLPVFDMGVTGKGINVVILDDGIEHSHTDLIDNYVSNSYPMNPASASTFHRRVPFRLALLTSS